MKKKFLVAVLAVVMSIACVLGIVACGDDDPFDGQTYVMYMIGEKDGEQCAMQDTRGEYKFDNGKFTYGEGDRQKTGTYKADGDKLVVTLKDGDKTESITFTKKDNYYKDVDGSASQTLALCKKGETPKGFKLISDED